MTDDVRISSWNLRASAGMTVELQFTAAEALTSLSVYTGGTITDVDDLTDATEHAGVLSGANLVATVDLAVGSASTPLRLVVNGAVQTVGKLYPSTVGTESPDNSITLAPGSNEFALTVLGVVMSSDAASQAELDAEATARAAGDAALADALDAKETPAGAQSKVDTLAAALPAAYATVEAVNPVQVMRISGNFDVAVSAAWADLDPGGTAAARPLDVVLPNMGVGDGWDFKPNLTLGTATGGFLMNLAIIKAGAVHRRLFSNAYGFFPWSAPSGQAKDLFSPIYRQNVQEGDLENGALRLRLQYIQATNVRPVNATVDIPLVLEGRGPLG